MKTNVPQETPSASSIAPPSQSGERWRKAHKSPVSWSKILREIKRPFEQLYAPIDIIFNLSGKLKQAEKEYPTVLSLNETVDLLIGGASICRFGDGEFNCLHSCAAPEHSPEWTLAQRLEKTLAYFTPPPPSFQDNPKQLVIAIPPFNPKYGNSPNKYGWLNFSQKYWAFNWEFMRERLMNRTFGNSFVSRLDVFYEVDIEKIRSIWSGRDVVFVVGKNGLFFDEPRLFSSIKSVEYLFVDPTEAYRHYETTLQQALAFDKSKLFIICAGYMATALAFDLYHHGYQALDMGHLPNCYRNYLKEAPPPEWLPKTVVRKSV